MAVVSPKLRMLRYVRTAALLLRIYMSERNPRTVLKIITVEHGLICSFFFGAIVFLELLLEYDFDLSHLELTNIMKSSAFLLAISFLFAFLEGLYLTHIGIKAGKIDNWKTPKM